MANEQTSVPLYASSEILTAANMNISAGTGVPVFATTVTRDAAFGGASEKVLAEGQLCYLSSTNVVQYYDGAAWATVGPTASGTKIGQVLSAIKQDTFTTSSASFIDVTGLTVSITPTLNTSKILVIVSISGGPDTGYGSGAATIARGGTNIFGGTASGNRTLGSQFEPKDGARMLTNGLSVLDSPATTSATTYSVQVMTSGAGGAFYVNRSVTNANSTGYFLSASSITVCEVIA
jgi:hypothetical protein